jgi:hypothetical protein
MGLGDCDGLFLHWAVLPLTFLLHLVLLLLPMSFQLLLLLLLLKMALCHKTLRSQSLRGYHALKSPSCQTPPLVCRARSPAQLRL